LIVAELSDSRSAAITEVVAIDFLLQHPSLLHAFLRNGPAALPLAAEPSPAETDASEEAFLRWKRSAVDEVAVPMLGRLIARGLLARSSPDALVLLPRGAKAARELRSRVGGSEISRLSVIGEQVVDGDPTRAGVWLRSALAEELHQ
jgi:hypothetical protein